MRSLQWARQGPGPGPGPGQSQSQSQSQGQDEVLGFEDACWSGGGGSSLARKTGFVAGVGLELSFRAWLARAVADSWAVPGVALTVLAAVRPPAGPGNRFHVKGFGLRVEG